MDGRGDEMDGRMRQWMERMDGWMDAGTMNGSQIDRHVDGWRSE